uniref:Adenylyltransferase and sulfurtransferase MOCS3 homolog n=1 Tax=Steinernema glaseri TaxID=37863 RepID=A0A1I8A382_9BILA
MTTADHSLPAEDVQRFGRQIIVKEFGVLGQERLSKASVLVVGAGGLGCPVATYLATSGLGRVGVVDYDVVDLNNIHRQFQFAEDSVGAAKAEELCRVLRRLNSKATFEAHVELFGPENARRLVRAYDVVADCSDNPATRYLVNDVCVLEGKPLVSGSALQWEGQLTVYNNGPSCPCYRCIFPIRPTAGSVTNCSDGGILGPVVGVIGSMQALEIIKVASGMPSALSGSLCVYDGLSTRVRTIKLRPKDPKCAVCGENPTITSVEPVGAVCTSEFCEKTMPISLLPESERISCSAYSKLRDGQKPLKLIDTRPPNEFAIGRLEEAINIPFDELSKKTKEELVGQLACEDEAEVFVICRRGNDSQRAVLDLREKLRDEKLGFRDLVGGYTSWAEEVDKTFPIY